MVRRTRILIGFLVGLLAVACSSSDSDKNDSKNPPGQTGATETNVAPASCEGDSDCPSGIACVFSDGATQVGHCDVAETETGGVSSAAPAPCTSDTDCPQGITCALGEGESVGFCDVEEHVVEPSGGTTSAAPAPCVASADCPPGISCVQFDPGGPGFCDVEEHVAP